jgi:FixJ family two-component response regulator
MNTAYGDIHLAVEAMKMGAIDFLVKPWTSEKLLASVRNCLDLGIPGRSLPACSKRKRSCTKTWSGDMKES